MGWFGLTSAVEEVEEGKNALTSEGIINIEEKFPYSDKTKLGLADCEWKQPKNCVVNSVPEDSWAFFAGIRKKDVIKEVDGIVYNEYPYVLDHFGPAQRVAFWNKFSMPDFGALRFVDKEELMYTWWIDPEKEAALAAAKEDSSITLETIPIENRFWQEWNAAKKPR